MLPKSAKPVIAVPPPLAARIGVRVMQVGVIAAVFASATWTSFELDRFLVPKELVLHATAVCAGLLMVRAIARLEMTRVDRLLVTYVFLSAASAALATNHWLALRALAVSVSALTVFWTTRALRAAGLDGGIVAAVAAAIVLVALTAIAQAYGLQSDHFALSRVPGGTLGNRNFVGHVAAFGLPVVVLAATRARGRWARWLAMAGTAVVGAALLLTRSRAAWLAAIVVTLVFAAVVAARRLRGQATAVGILVPIGVTIGIGIAVAVVVPNSLRWRSETPYLDTAGSVTSYDEGSGRGRLRQYEHSLRLTLAHPWLGVGPGNWPVQYPRDAPDGDGSLSASEPGMALNPWPSSDWVAFLSERGPLAAVVFGLAIAVLALGSLRHAITNPAAEQALSATVLLAILAGASVAGAFDAVLVLGLPALLVWAVAGALWIPPVPLAAAPAAASARTIPGPLVWAMILVAGVGLARSAAEAAAMEIVATRADRASLERAARVDPGNYRLQMRLARRGARDSRCEHARAAQALFPNALAAAALARACDE